MVLGLSAKVAGHVENNMDVIHFGAKYDAPSVARDQVSQLNGAHYFADSPI